MVMTGCNPPAAALRPDVSAVKPEPEVQAPLLLSEPDHTCPLLADNRSGSSFWLGPSPVVDAKKQAERCRSTSAASFIEERLQGGLLLFGEGRFGESADVFREGISEADSDGTRTRLLAEMGKSLLADGRTEEAGSAFEQALSIAEKGAAPAQDQPPRGANPHLFSRLARNFFPLWYPEREVNHQEIYQQQQRRDAADKMGQIQTELLVLVGLAKLQTNNVAGAIERLREAKALVERQGAKAGSDRSMVLPYLALALQRAGRN